MGMNSDGSNQISALSRHRSRRRRKRSEKNDYWPNLSPVSSP